MINLCALTCCREKWHAVLQFTILLMALTISPSKQMLYYHSKSPFSQTCLLGCEHFSCPPPCCKWSHLNKIQWRRSKFRPHKVCDVQKKKKTLNLTTLQPWICPQSILVKYAHAHSCYLLNEWPTASNNTRTLTSRHTHGHTRALKPSRPRPSLHNHLRCN